MWEETQVRTKMKTRAQRKSQILFERGVNMAKQELEQSIWYNLNIDRLNELISFCMEYISCHEGLEPIEEGCRFRVCETHIHSN